MAVTAHSLPVRQTIGRLHAGGHRLVGLLIAMLVPALFWTGVIAAIGAKFGLALSASLLAGVAIAIAATVAAICIPIMFGNRLVD